MAGELKFRNLEPGLIRRREAMCSLCWSFFGVRYDRGAFSIGGSAGPGASEILGVSAGKWYSSGNGVEMRNVLSGKLRNLGCQARAKAEMVAMSVCANRGIIMIDSARMIVVLQPCVEAVKVPETHVTGMSCVQDA